MPRVELGVTTKRVENTTHSCYIKHTSMIMRNYYYTHTHTKKTIVYNRKHLFYIVFLSLKHNNGVGYMIYTWIENNLLPHRSFFLLWHFRSVATAINTSVLVTAVLTLEMRTCISWMFTVFIIRFDALNKHMKFWRLLPPGKLIIPQ